jgi:hypothetical protein
MTGCSKQGNMLAVLKLAKAATASMLLLLASSMMPLPAHGATSGAAPAAAAKTTYYASVPVMIYKGSEKDIYNLAQFKIHRGAQYHVVTKVNLGKPKDLTKNLFTGARAVIKLPAGAALSPDELDTVGAVPRSSAYPPRTPVISLAIIYGQDVVFEAGVKYRSPLERVDSRGWYPWDSTGTVPDMIKENPVEARTVNLTLRVDPVAGDPGLIAAGCQYVFFGSSKDPLATYTTPPSMIRVTDFSSLRWARSMSFQHI